MSNNIYNILGKLNSLTPKEETPKTVEQKPVYESVEARGSVLEGISAVESKLARMFAEEKANEDMLAKKDYDGDGKKESPKDEYMGSKDNAIKKAMGKKDIDEKEGHGESDPLANRADYAKRHGTGQVYKKTHAGDKTGMTHAYAYDIKRTGPKGVLPEQSIQEETHGQYLAQKEKEAQSSGKSSFQAFKQTHPVDGKPGVEEEVEEGAMSDMDADKKDKQYKGTQAYHAKKKAEKEKTDTKKAEEKPLEEDFEDLQKYLDSKAKGAKQGGGAGKKQGTRYGGSLQKDDEGDAEPAADNAPKKKGRPKKDKFAESWKVHAKAKLAEGVNFAEMMREANAEADELLTELQMEISEFKKSGHMGDKLRDVLELHKFSKKPIVDEVVMPAMEQPMIESGAFIPGRIVYWRGKQGTVDRVEGNKCFVNKPNGEMDVWPTRECSTEKQGMLDTLGGDIKGIGQGIKNFVMNKPDPMDEEKDQKDDFFHNPDIPADRQLPAPPKQVDVELNELAKLAGLSEAKKCNHTMEGKSCPVHGLKECGSMTEAKKPDFLDLDKDGDKKEPMKDAAKDSKKKKVDECGMPGSMSPMSNMDQDEGNMSINTSMNSDGTKSVSVNATGNQADALAQILKMAGLAAHQSVHGGGEMSAAEPKAIVIQAGPEEQVEEERDIEYANTPDEEVENVDAIIHQGDDLNREKEQYAGMAKAGDNPMATRESIEMPARISRMLEGVKLASK